MRIAERLQLLKLRRAMSLSQAKELLGFPPTASPAKNEIERNYKKLALQNHPDLGGDIEKMKLLNVARDVLEGRQRPTRDNPSTSRPQPQPKAPKSIIFEIAAREGGYAHGRLTVDGKAYVLSKGTLEFLSGSFNHSFMTKIFGKDHYWAGGKKDLLKQKDKDEILSRLVRIFIHTHETSLVDALGAVGVKP